MPGRRNAVAYRKEVIRQNIKVKAARIVARRYFREYQEVIEELTEGKDPSRAINHAISIGEGSDVLHVTITCTCGEVADAQVTGVYDWWRHHTDPVKK